MDVTVFLQVTNAFYFLVLIAFNTSLSGRSPEETHLRNQ